MPQAKLVPVVDLDAAMRTSDWDAVVAIGPAAALGALESVGDTVRAAAAVDALGESAVTLLPCDVACGGRLVSSPTGPLGREQDDVRRFADAAVAGIRRARDAGASRPLCIVAGVPSEEAFHAAPAVTALALAGALWEPLEAREAHGDARCEPVEAIGFAVAGGACPANLGDWVDAVECGRRLARDLCGTEPERMAPPRFAEACVDAFAGTGVTVSVLAEADEVAAGYPLLWAVARASLGVARHRPRIVRLEYEGRGPIESTLCFAGKGVTYDTGGADLKTNGSMAGMSRDKGGAAAVAGFVRAVAALAPAGVRVVAELGLVRNSIGSESFVTDEIITSHAGVRVRIGNTDAEGRLVLADLLSHLRERALTAEGARLFSVATLTGHAARAVGPYTALLDNAPARAAGVAAAIARAGDAWGDPSDEQRLRPEDWDFVAAKSKAEDVVSCNSAPSSVTARGHQFPMAFLAIASGLSRHGPDGDPPLGYTHVDIAGSAVERSDWQHGRPTARPIVALLAGLLGDTLS